DDREAHAVGDQLRRNRAKGSRKAVVRHLAGDLGHPHVESEERDREREHRVREGDQAIATHIGGDRVAVHAAPGGVAPGPGPRPRPSSQLAMCSATSCQPSSAMIQCTWPGNSRKSVRALERWYALTLRRFTTGGTTWSFSPAMSRSGARVPLEKLTRVGLRGSSGANAPWKNTRPVSGTTYRSYAARASVSGKVWTKP